MRIDTILLSVLVHTFAVGIVVIVPILATDELPEPRRPCLRPRRLQPHPCALVEPFVHRRRLCTSLPSIPRWRGHHGRAVS